MISQRGSMTLCPGPLSHPFAAISKHATCKCFRITSFAHPHPLSPLFAHLSKKQGGGGSLRANFFSVRRGKFDVGLKLICRGVLAGYHCARISEVPE